MSKYFRQIQWADLDEAYLRAAVLRARDEDLQGAGLLNKPTHEKDLTTDAIGFDRETGSAVLKARQPMVVCGLNLIPLILGAYGGPLEVNLKTQDGVYLHKDTELGTLTGSISQILQAERIILNFLQYLSGIATNTYEYCQMLADSPTRLLDTRKTTPGYRMLEKYAVACGGGWNHRLGLFDWILIKDNHLSGAGAASGQSLKERVLRAKQLYPDVALEVEVDELAQIEPALDGGADIIMLDNFDDIDLAKAVSLIKNRAITEASGGINLQRLQNIRSLGLDYISIGALIHQSQWVDMGLDWLY